MDNQELEKLLTYIHRHHHEQFIVEQALAGGYQDGAILVRNRAGQPFVLKQWYRPQAIQLLTILAKRGYPSSAPTIAGQTDTGQHYWLQEYRPGRPMAVLEEGHLAQIEAINLLQAACIQPLPEEVENNWSTYAYRVVFANESGWVERLRAYSPDVAHFVETLQQRVQPWQATPLTHNDAVHGDFTPDNLVVQGNRITGVIDTAGMGCGTRAIDMATLLHYAYLYDYSNPVKQRLHSYLVQHFDQGTIYITVAYRILAMLAWAAEHDPPAVVADYMAKSATLLQVLAAG